MLLINNTSVEPYYNQAVEEFLLNNIDDDIVMIWQNKNTIVVGKHQNALAEINYEFVNLNQTKVVRRLSGGGTVYHDEGNINFTFIKKYEGQNPGIDFRKFLNPIVQILNKYGLNAEFSGRNDILASGKKISGNAEHIFHRQKKILHHGTLLFSSNLDFLKNALRDNSEFYSDKSVKSIRSSVCNISELLNTNTTIENFKNVISGYFSKLYQDITPFEFSEIDKTNVQNLADTKYSQWNWNYGYSPKYVFHKKTETSEGVFEVKFSVEKGEILSAEMSADFIPENHIQMLRKALTGKEHRQETILEILKENPFYDYFKKLNNLEIFKVFF